MAEGYSIRQLSAQCGKHPARLRRIINHWLAQCPPPETSSFQGIEYVIFDGTYLHRPVSIVVVMDAATNSVVAGAHGVSERSEQQISRFLSPLKERGLKPVSFTTDGNPRAIKAITGLWPEVTIQRCLVHVQRQGLMWCRENPQRPDSKALRDVFLEVMMIDTEREREEFISRVRVWEETYGKPVREGPDQGRVFSDLKKARSMLMRALPDMFHYLDDPSIPKTTNGLEGYFSRLKDHYPHHRGLAPDKRNSYFAWYFRLRPR